MRILLVTLTDVLPYALTQVLNPANDYCAIVVDEPDIAKKNLINEPQPLDKIYPFYELKECIKNNYYDAVLFMCEHPIWHTIIEQIRAYGVPGNKFLNVSISYSTRHRPFLLERALRYYKEHAAEFEMFATGGCYTELGLDNTKFRYKLFNVGKGNQDLYFRYQIAKFILDQNSRVGGNLKYALVGLAPFIFHYDASRTPFSNSMLQNCIAFNDMHNFWLPVEQYKKLFREEFLNTRLPLENIDLNNIFLSKSSSPKFLDVNARINARRRIDVWENKSFPDTVKENIQILDDYLTLCETNNVRPIMVQQTLSEAYMRYFNKKKLDEFYYLVNLLQKKHPDAIFFDGWKLEDFSDEYFIDVDHMNINYAAKFSAILNEFIENLEKK